MRTISCAVFCLLLTAAFVVHAETRVALVIGNAAYTDAPLANPVNDAHLIATSLKQAGFQVTEYANLDLDHLRKAIQGFGDQLSAAGQKRAALVYYSPHGVQASGHNYLIPIGASLHREADLELQALDASVLVNIWRMRVQGSTSLCWMRAATTLSSTPRGHCARALRRWTRARASIT
jgi:hypothetical protein